MHSLFGTTLILYLLKLSADKGFLLKQLDTEFLKNETLKYGIKTVYGIYSCWTPISTILASLKYGAFTSLVGAFTSGSRSSICCTFVFTLVFFVSRKTTKLWWMQKNYQMKPSRMNYLLRSSSRSLGWTHFQTGVNRFTSANRIYTLFCDDVFAVFTLIATYCARANAYRVLYNWYNRISSLDDESHLIIA